MAPNPPRFAPRPADPDAPTGLQKLVRAVAGTSFFAPTWLWMGINLVVGVLSGHAMSTWAMRLVLPLLLGPVLAVISVVDRRTVYRRFRGGRQLWAQVPGRIKFRFILRTLIEITLLVTIPGLLAAVLMGVFYPSRLITYMPPPDFNKVKLPKVAPMPVTRPASAPASLPASMPHR